MADLASFWVGGQLGPIEIASLQSFIRHGDKITLYSPERIGRLPEEVEWKDASEIMPCDEIILHHKTQSPALHSDLFRYQLLAKTNQIWVDLDVIALRPFEFGSEWVFGYETPDEVNGAVLRLPRDSETYRRLLAFVPDTRGLPPHLTGFRRVKYWLRGLGRGGVPIERWPWGSIGPRLLTQYLRETGEIAHALPISAFYSVPLSDAGRFLEPGAINRKTLPEDAWAVHLWGSKLRREINARYQGEIPQGSFLDLASRGELE